MNPRTQELQYNLELAEGEVPGESTLQALRELEQLGLVEKTGELRNGKPVWALTALYHSIQETAPELLEIMLD